MPQSAIARIERGRITPGFDAVQRLLGACGMQLDLGSRRGVGIDRTVIRELLRLTPAERLRLAAAAANNLLRLRKVTRPVRAVIRPHRHSS
jgi:transcriptional regulator with XRE-family HTH domain